MVEQILGIDLGTGSIGMAKRNPFNGNSVREQLEFFSVDVFQSGVGMEKSSEYSLAADRTKHRQSRRLYDVRRRKLWATLGLLIDNGMCPMKPESLRQWRTYDRKNNLFRKYPVDDEDFARWIKLDFNGDGKPDFTSPYQIRRLLVENQLDFTQPINKMMLGRALYHIAQHRGFKSSKIETLKENVKEFTEIDVVQAKKSSEEKLSKGIDDYINKHNLKTVGQAFAYLELDGERIRDNAVYKAVRTEYVDEIRTIFKFQEGLDVDSELFQRLTSTKKDVGTIFYKKPLRSQKSLVGYCTLEPGKKRCPASHPFFEIFKAWGIINNIKYRKRDVEDWEGFSLVEKEKLFFKLFVSRGKRNFRFDEIRKFIEKEVAHCQLQYLPHHAGTINYKDNQGIDGCPVCSCLYKLLADVCNIEAWPGTRAFIDLLQKKVIQGSKSRSTHGKKSLQQHIASYSALDVWSVCYNAEESDDVLAFAHNPERLGLQDNKGDKLLVRTWKEINPAYASLSMKALSSINRLLIRGLNYSDAVMLAKLPDIVDDFNDESIMQLAEKFNKMFRPQFNHRKLVIQITNKLIADYKALTFDEQFAYKNVSYILDNKDQEDIVKAIEDVIGNRRWSDMDSDEQMTLINDVTRQYQQFFSSNKRTFVAVPALKDAWVAFLKKKYPQVNPKEWSKLYHHSDLTLYAPQRSKNDATLRLGSPNVGSIRNPVVLRTLNKLRRKLNDMLDHNLITTDTLIVIETAREFNDANWRWAIERYQRNRDTENTEIKKILEKFTQDYHVGKSINDTDLEKARLVIEQHVADNDQDSKKKLNYDSVKKNDIARYKTWLQQGCICLYTGKPIGMAQLFDENVIDLEHTIPRSLSFDNSEANLTVCDAHYNRSIKKNLLPTQLPNYSTPATINGVTYPAIVGNLKKWEDKVAQLADNVEFWKSQSRIATMKDRKDYCIRQKHLWELELRYWKNKLERFCMEEVTDGFRNSQLVDTRIITKYATLFLKSVFTHVKVLKGSDTALFRKILGIESMDEKKDRSKHLHHAIDAMALTMIPDAVKAKRLREVFYKLQEAKKRNDSTDIRNLSGDLKSILATCHIAKDVSSAGGFIEKNLLVNHHAQDKVLRPNRQEGRIGKEITIVKDGKKKKVWARGDALRGRMNKDTHYGAVMLPERSENGNFIYADKNARMVVRVDIKKMKEKDIDAIVDPKVRTWIHDVVKRRMENGDSFTKAIAEDIWMIDKNGVEKRFDKNGRPLRPIRHVRCFAKAGMGYLTYKTCNRLRRHIDTSTKKLVNLPDRRYKSFIYTQTDTNHVFLLYEGMVGNKRKRASKIINLFEISKLIKAENFTTWENFFENEPLYNHFTSKDGDLKLAAVITPGQKVMRWYESPAELHGLVDDKEELSKRLYIVYKFNKKGASDILYLQSHLSHDEEVKLAANKFNVLIEHRDFEIDLLGNIVLKTDD